MLRKTQAAYTSVLVSSTDLRKYGLVHRHLRTRARERGLSGSSATLRALTPDPEVPARVQRRQFTAEHRRRFLTEADACQKPGALGALLRREGLYSSHLANWRRQREQGELLAGRARKRGPTAIAIDPRVRQLEVENRRLQRKLARAETIITLQKKLPRSWGSP